MRHSPASSRTRFLPAALALAAATLGAASASAAPVSEARAAERYEQCLAHAHGDPKAALADAEKWRIAKGGLPAQHCAGVALFELKRYREAAVALEKLGRALAHGDPDLRAGAFEQAGQAWLLDSAPPRAKAAFDEALKVRPDDPDLLIDRAEAEAAAGRYGDAVEDLTHALRAAPGRPDALIYRASAYRRLERLDLALRDLDDALSRAPGEVAGLLERGNVRSLKGDVAGAKADWQRVVALAPADPAASAARKNLEAVSAQRLITEP